MEKASCTPREIALLALSSREYEGEHSVLFNPTKFSTDWLAQILYATYVYSNPSTNIEKVCAKGDASFLEQLIIEGYKIDDNAFIIATINNHVKCLEVLLNRAKNFPVPREYCCNEASKRGHLECLKLLFMRAPTIYESTLVNAIMFDHSDCADLCLDHAPAYRQEKYSAFLVLSAIKHRAQKCLNLFLIEYKMHPAHEEISESIHHPVEYMRLLLDCGAPVPPTLFSTLLQKGKMDHLRLLVERKTPGYKQYAHYVIPDQTK